MMAWWHWNASRIIDPFWGESTPYLMDFTHEFQVKWGIHFLCCYLEQLVEQPNQYRMYVSQWQADFTHSPYTIFNIMPPKIFHASLTFARRLKHAKHNVHKLQCGTSCTASFILYAYSDVAYIPSCFIQ